MRVLGEKDPLTLRTQVRLAELHYLAGRKDEALAGFTSVLDVQERILGFDHPDVARSRDFINRILAERSVAIDVAEANSTEAYPIQGLAPPENVLPPATVTESNSSSSTSTEPGKVGKKTGAVERFLGNVRSVIGGDKPNENDTEDEK